MNIHDYLKREELSIVHLKGTWDKRTRIWKYEGKCRKPDGGEVEIHIEGATLAKIKGE
jgi:hypothetical protein